MRILVAEDEAHNRIALGEMLERMGNEVVLCEDGQSALEQAAKSSFDLILSDVRMPRLDGLAFFSALKNVYSENETRPDFVFMTAYGRLEEAVEAMRQGALNFLSKPIRKKDLIGVLSESTRQIKSKVSEKRSTIQKNEIVYKSRAFAEVVQMVERVSGSLASVLFVGESGTGKEVLAKLLHEKSARKNGPFVAFHAGATPESLFESELFGHEKGAYTGADSARLGQIRQAHHGTFFIDELSSMPLSVQTKLLRVIQERTVTPLGSTHPVECDVRWVSATNIELETLAERGLFRSDLLYRLRVMVIEIPPLRNRAEDIEPLAQSFLDEFGAREGRPALKLDDETRSLLESYSWPGNVRELRNVVERAVALANGDVFDVSLLPQHISHSKTSKEIMVYVGSSLQSVEDRLIEETLKSCHGDKAQAAAILGVAPRTIYRWLERRSES